MCELLIQTAENKSKGMMGGGYDPDKEVGPSPVTYTSERRASKILTESHIATLLD